MANQVPLFLPWEIALYLTLMQKPISILFPDIGNSINTYKAVIDLQIPVTVDQFRQNLNLPPHPDGNNMPQRGSLFVYQPDPGTQSSDSLMPDLALVQAWNEIVTTDNSKTTHDNLVTQYQALYNLASEAASNLGVQLL